MHSCVIILGLQMKVDLGTFTARYLYLYRHVNRKFLSHTTMNVGFFSALPNMNDSSWYSEAIENKIFCWRTQHWHLVVLQPTFFGFKEEKSRVREFLDGL